MTLSKANFAQITSDLKVLHLTSTNGRNRNLFLQGPDTENVTPVLMTKFLLKISANP